jgi:serine/threonine protein kinase
MDETLWIKAKELFHETLAKPPTERDEFLKQACGQDEPLLKQVKELLDSYESGFMNEPALSKVVEAINDSNLLEEGSMFGRYRVARLIGSGGMGEVYLAHDAELDRPVALKLLHRDVAEDKERLRRFIQEARAASALNHPNILTIYEIGTHEGTRFIVSEYIDGETLRDRMCAGMTPSDSVDITCQVATALQAAHAAGIVHRDIKPENIMLRRDGLVKILDFGLAKLTEADDKPLDANAPLSRVHTTPGLVMGTVAYMSPEQARGLAVDARTDLWSLGVVLHEMLTGESPFKGDSAIDLVNSLIKHDRISLDSDSLPPELRPICSKALDKDQKFRYQSAQQFLLDLQGEKKRMEYAIQPTPFISISGIDDQKTQMIRRRPTLSAEYIVTSVKRHKYATLLTAAMIAVSAIALSVYRYNGATPPSSEQSLVAIDPSTTEKDLKFSRVATSGMVFDVAISPDGKYLAYVAGTTERRSIWLKQLETQNDFEIVPALGEGRLMRPKFTPDGKYIYYVHNTPQNNQVYKVSVQGGAPTKITEHTNGAVSVSPDGKHIAFERGEGDEGKVLAIANVDGSNERAVAKTTDWREVLYCQGSAAWSPDGSKVACWIEFVSDKDAITQLFSFSTVDGSRQLLTEQKWRNISGAVWLSNGSLLLAAQEKSNEQIVPAQIWLVTPTGETKRITADNTGYTTLSATASGDKIASLQSATRRDLCTLPNNDVSRAKQITYSGELGGGYSTMPDGKIVISSSVTGNYELWMLTADGTGRKQLTADEGTNPKVTPDGRYIVFTSMRTGLRSLYRMNADGTNLKELNQTTPGLIGISSDSKWIYYLPGWDGEHAIKKLPIDGGAPISIVPITELWSRYAFSRGDDQLAEFWTDTTPKGTRKHIRIYSVKDAGKLVKTIDLPPTASNGPIHWTPDGRAIAFHDSRNGVANIWRIPIDGKGPARPVTNFASPGTVNFEWTRDGKQMIVSRATTTNDAMLITNAKQ